MSDVYLYHPSRGVWVAVRAPSPAILAGYPTGTVEISAPPGPGYIFDGSAWVTDPEYAEQFLLSLRTNTNLSLGELLGNMVDAGWINETAAENWLDRVALPAPLVAEIQSRPNPKTRIIARATFFASSAWRMDPVWNAAFARFGKTDAEIDLVFGIAP